MYTREIHLARRHLPAGGLFHYFRDRWALTRLGWHLRAPVRVHHLKGTELEPLLRVPTVRETIGAWVDPVELACVYPRERTYAFRLGAGGWGGSERKAEDWEQITVGPRNLVLRLDFTNQHDLPFKALWKPAGGGLSWAGHPTTPGGHTLAWARLDLDLRRGHALIEEIQSDWVRIAAAARGASALHEGDATITPLGSRGTRARLAVRYVDQVLAPYRALWQEAMLALVLEVLRDRLGVGFVWMHTFGGGNRAKHLEAGDQPPRSIYEKLPKRFRFTRTTDGPPWVLRARKDLVGVDWWMLAVPGATRARLAPQSSASMASSR